MKIVVAGDERRVSELKKKMKYDFIYDNSVLHKRESIDQFDVIIDLNADERTESSSYFTLPENSLLILSAVKKSLTKMIHESGSELKSAVTGINALPTFIDRSKWEVSFNARKSYDRFEALAKELSIDFLEVQDRTGMATPRVICMIINEACFTLQEGTASMGDIDKGMKLGTNYPFGPFEWSDQIGIKDVYETLDAVWNDTHDPRYKICSLLKTKYLKGESFY